MGVAVGGAIVAVGVGVAVGTTGVVAVGVMVGFGDGTDVAVGEGTGVEEGGGVGVGARVGVAVGVGRGVRVDGTQAPATTSQTAARRAGKDLSRSSMKFPL